MRSFESVISAHHVVKAKRENAASHVTGVASLADQKGFHLPEQRASGLGA